MANERWLRRFDRSQPGVPRVVCFPHAGGSASSYFALSQQLAPDVEVVAVQYPGRQERRTEQFVTEVPAMAEQVVEALDGLGIDGSPLSLFGHSMGAAVAFEAARLLEQSRGVDLAALVVSGRRAPSVSRGERIRSLRDADLIAELRRLDGTDSSFLDDTELLEMVMPAVRNDYGAILRYRYRPGLPLRCALTAIVGDADPQAAIDEVGAWRDHTTGPFDLHVVEGGHFYLATSIEQLARMVRVAVVRA